MPATGGDVYLTESPELPQGSVLGSYQIIESLGSGTMGRVYLAEHARLERKVALKVLHQDLLRNPLVVRRFFDEARAANRIDHENIVEVTDFVEDSQRNLVYIVMELLKGTNLATLISLKGVLPVPRVARIGAQIASALYAAHQVGIIHRDLKSANVFLVDRVNQEDFVKVLDFGVAKLAETRAADFEAMDSDDSTAGRIVGTPAYMSPEQALGQAVDHRTDIYSLGVILFEAATGQRPFIADHFGEYVIQHLTADPPKPSDIAPPDTQLPWVLEDLILRCLKKKPSKRPASMEEVWKLLEALSERHLRESIIVPEAPASRRRMRRRYWVVAVAAGAILVGGAAAGLLIHRRIASSSDELQTQGSATPHDENDRATQTSGRSGESLPATAHGVASIDAGAESGALRQSRTAENRRSRHDQDTGDRRSTQGSAEVDTGIETTPDGLQPYQRRGVIDPFEAEQDSVDPSAER